MEVDDGTVDVSVLPDDASIDVDIADAGLDDVEDTFGGDDVSTRLQEVYAEAAACEALLAQVGSEEVTADFDPYEVALEDDSVTVELQEVYAQAAACEALLAETTQPEGGKTVELEEALRSLKPSELQKRAAAAGATSDEIEAACDDEQDSKAALIALVIAKDRHRKVALQSLKASELQKRAVAVGANSDEIENALDDERDPKAALIALVLAKEQQSKVADPIATKQSEQVRQASQDVQTSQGLAHTVETEQGKSSDAPQHLEENKEVLNSLLGGYGSDSSDGEVSAERSEGEVSAEPNDIGCRTSQTQEPPTKVSNGSAAGQKEQSRKDLEFMILTGCSVRVSGLQKAKELNGLQGIVRQLDPSGSGRWEVELKTTGGGSEVKMIRSQNLLPSDSKLDVGRTDKDAECAISVGCVVRVSGLQKAKELNGLQGTVRQLDPSGSGRWEIVLKKSDGATEVKMIRSQNLVLAENAENSVDDKSSNACEMDNKPDSACQMEVDHSEVDVSTTDNCNEVASDDMRSNSSEEEEEDEEDAPLKVGDVVRIDGLKGAAHLNGQTGSLERFDLEADRWEVKLPNGEIKAIKPCNLAHDAPDEEVAKESDSSNLMPNVEGCADEFGKLDDNEIVAKALEAELSGDAAMAAKLNAIIDDRRKSLGCHVSSDEGPRVEEMIEVPDQVVGQIIGHGGERIKKLSADTGARLNFLNSDTEGSDGQVLFARGSANAVAKAKSLVQAVIASVLSGKGGKGKKGKGKGKGKRGVQEILSGAAAGSEEGICKWWAAGFCRNMLEHGTSSCRNGKHDSGMAVDFEKKWLNLGPVPGSVPPPEKRPVLFLLDLEGGGDAEGRNGEDEIIELPVLAMCGASGRELGRFHRFLRPGYWDRESALMHRKFPASCFNDQSIAEAFAPVVPSLIEYICKVLGVAPGNLDNNQFLFVTCGNWDVKTALPRQSNKPAPGAPGSVDLATQQLLFSRWCNMKEIFKLHYQLSENDAPTGMKGMLRMLRIPLVGQHHLGMDDVSNLSKILKQIVLEEANIVPTGFARNLGATAAQAGQAFMQGKKNGSKDKSGKGACKKGKMEGKTKHKGNSGNECKGKGCKGKEASKGKGKMSSTHVTMDGMSFAKASQPPPYTDPSAARGLKRSARDPSSDAPPGSAPRKESWNPWDTSAVEVEETLPPEQADLKEFLKGAPRPGEDWEFEEDANEDAMEVGIKKVPQENGVGLVGVLGNDGANLQSSEAPPAKATSIASLLASLPKPTSSCE